MGKLKQVSPDEISTIIEKAEDITHGLRDISDRIEKGYIDLDDVALYDEEITSLTILARNTLHLSHILQMKTRMVRHTTALEQRLRQKA